MGDIVYIVLVKCLKFDIHIYIFYLFHDAESFEKSMEKHGIVDNGTYAVRNDVNR